MNPEREGVRIAKRLARLVMFVMKTMYWLSSAHLDIHIYIYIYPQTKVRNSQYYINRLDWMDWTG